MNRRDLLSSIDAEILRLQQVRSLLSNGSNGTRGNKTASTKTAATKRVMSPEARKRIGDAQKNRWAAVRKAK